MPHLKFEVPDLKETDAWINTDQVDLEDGMSLVYFWNYSCSCCRTRLELFEKIHQECSDLSVLGIHDPRFDFERDIRNLKDNVERLDIRHPIVQDKSGKISEAFDIAYSNSVLIIDSGKIEYQKPSNQDFEGLMKKLSEIMNLKDDVVKIGSDKQVEVPTKIFLGYDRAEGFNEEGNYPGEKKYRLPRNRKPGFVYLENRWNQKENYIEASQNSELRFNFSSSKFSIVVSPNGSIKDVEVLVNGEKVSEAELGDDLRLEDGKSYIRVKKPGVYNLIDSNDRKKEITLLPDKKTRIHSLNIN